MKNPFVSTTKDVICDLNNFKRKGIVKLHNQKHVAVVIPFLVSNRLRLRRQEELPSQTLIRISVSHLLTRKLVIYEICRLARYHSSGSRHSMLQVGKIHIFGDVGTTGTTNAVPFQMLNAAFAPAL